MFKPLQAICFFLCVVPAGAISPVREPPPQRKNKPAKEVFAERGSAIVTDATRVETQQLKERVFD